MHQLGIRGEIPTNYHFDIKEYNEIGKREWDALLNDK